MHIIVTGGGTGGHVFPALEIVKELKRQNQNIQITYVGNKNSLEEKMAKMANISFYGLSAKKVVGQSIYKKIVAFYFLKIAVLQSLWFLLKQRPQAVIGVGGYVSAPMIIASIFLGIKRYICEQNVVPGMANKNLSRIAKRVFISFKASQRYFQPKKTILSGNPVRQQFFSLAPKNAKETFNILITGGSLGAGFLNREVPQVLNTVRFDIRNLVITHQTGEPAHKEVCKLYTDLNLQATVIPFIENMPQAFFEHDVLISRAGATVCAEIMASGMPAILVPYPFAGAHQKYNALALDQLGAAILIEEDKNFKSHLALTLKNLYSEPKMLHQLAVKAKGISADKAAFVIASTVLNDL